MTICQKVLEVCDGLKFWRTENLETQQQSHYTGIEEQQDTQKFDGPKEWELYRLIRCLHGLDLPNNLKIDHIFPSTVLKVGNTIVFSGSPQGFFYWLVQISDEDKYKLLHILKEDHIKHKQKEAIRREYEARKIHDQISRMYPTNSVTRCAECDCKSGGTDCNWIQTC